MMAGTNSTYTPVYGHEHHVDQIEHDVPPPHYLSEQDATKSKDLQAFVNIIKSFVGVGILALPYGIRMAGLWAAIPSLFIIAVVSNYTIKNLIKCKREILLRRRVYDEIHRDTNHTYPNEDAHKLEHVSAPKAKLLTHGGVETADIISYGEIGTHIFGKMGLYLVNFAVITSQIGFCCAYVVFMSQNLYSIYTDIDLRFWVLIIYPIITILSWIKNIKYLSPTSIFANLALLLGITVVFYFGFSRLELVPVSEYPGIRISTFPMFFGIAVFGFEGINLAIPIESNMRKPQNYFRLLDIAMIIIFLLYSAFGVFGYLFFRDQTSDIITENLPKASVVTVVTKVALVAELLCTYPIQLFPVCNIVEDAIFKPETTFVEVKRVMVRTVLVSLTVVVAIFIPYFDLVTSLIGSFSNSMAAFIFPTIFMISVFRGRLSWSQIILNIVILIIGIIASAVSSALSITNIIKKFEGQ
eukprot:TRINITY_DN1060_c0_g1_i9.p1 TRINITY_DN1060_c0_g1~~TRINITY_DN1060_c0_g1_i9.p1  ORF type:complete len:469 (-),score=74.70 TRINITY_DN1060_c0_g1_i9:68-1474(-)